MHDLIDVETADLHFDSEIYGDDLSNCVYITKSNNSLTPPCLGFIHEFINHQYYSRNPNSYMGTSEFDTVDDTIRKLESEIGILLKKLDDARDLKKAVDRINLANSINEGPGLSKSSYVRQPYPKPETTYVGETCRDRYRFPKTNALSFPNSDIFNPDLIPCPIGIPLYPGEPISHGTGNKTYIYKGSQTKRKEINDDC